MTQSRHVVHSTTDSRKAAEKLRGSEERYRNLFENCRDAISITTPDGKFVDVNQAWLDLFGYSRDEMPRLAAKNVYADPSERDRFRRMMEEKRFVKDYEARLRKKNGAVIDCLAASSVWRATDGRTLAYQTIVRDVTERKKMEEALRDSEEKFRAIFDNANDGILVAGEDKKFILGNRAICRMLGYCQEEVKKLGVADIHPEEDLPYVMEQFEKITGQQIRVAENIPVKRRDGSVFYADITSALFSLRGRYWIGVFRDMTRVRRLEEQTRFRSDLLGKVHDAIIAVDEQLAVTAWNRAAEEMYGWKAEEVLGQNVLEFIRSDSTEARLSALLRTLAETGSNRAEGVHGRKDGQPIYVEGTFTALYGAEGRITGYVIVNRDITERKQMEKELQRAHAQYRAVVDDQTELICRFAPDGALTFVNQAYCHYFNKKREELVGHYFMPVVPEDHEKTKRLKASIGPNDPAITYDQRIVLPDGEIRWQQWTDRAIFDEQGKPMEFQSVGRDITERKRMEEELRRHTESLEELVEERTREIGESEKRFRELADLLPQIVYEIDEKGDFLFVNQAGLDISGYSREDFAKGLNALDMFAPNDRDRVKGNMRKILTGEKIHGVEYTAMRKDGTTFPVMIYTNSILRDNTPVGFRGIAVDITERKKTERQLHETQRMAAIGEASAMVGHDLRNPLQVIVNDLYLAEKAVENLSHPDSEVAMKLSLEKLFKELGEQIRYMDKIVSDLQDYARPLRPLLVETQLNHILDDVFSTFKIPENVKIIKETDRDVRLAVDPYLVRRLLANLLTNAVQAMPNGGQLTVKASKKEGVVVISIQDTGGGIHKEILDKIFTPFSTTKARGMGLGLPVCKRMVEAHGGTITAESKKGEGSIFTVRLPLKRIDERDE
jgi:PAS domain S-box-containing protein